MMEQQMNKELLSALVDGELHGDELEQALACAESAQGCASWELYHLVGDVLRSPDLAHHSQHDLLTGLRAQLAQEPSLSLASAPLEQVAAPLESSHSAVVALRDPAANASVFRWKVAASFASVAAVAAIGWNLMGVPAQDGALLASQTAPAAETVVVTENGESVLRDPRLDALMASHQQYASRAALQAPAEFLRNASLTARSARP
ncbi:MAG: sigma-E factor negative regulatory protein [Comamonas sp.]